MQAHHSLERFVGFAFVLVAACGGVVAWMTQSRSVPNAVLPEPATSILASPTRPSASEIQDESLGSHEPPHAIEAEDADERDAGPNSGCAPLLWVPTDEKEFEREQLAEYPDAFPIYRYVSKVARPLDDAVSALLPNHGKRGKCGQGVTFGYDLQGGPAKRHCDDEGKCRWIVRATIIDDRSYHPAEKVNSALPWVYWFEVERVGAPVIVEFSTSWNESTRFTKISDAVHFIQERVRAGGLAQRAAGSNP